MLDQDTRLFGDNSGDDQVWEVKGEAGSENLARCPPIPTNGIQSGLDVEASSSTPRFPTAVPIHTSGRSQLQDVDPSVSMPTQLHQDPSSSSSQTPGVHRDVGSLGRGMACGFCRRRKLRCSGDRPLCANCAKYSKECEYGPAPKIAKVQALESRITQLSNYIHSVVPDPGPILQPLKPQASDGDDPSSSAPAFSESLNSTTNGMPDGLPRANAEPYCSHPFSSPPEFPDFTGVNNDEYLDFSGYDQQAADYESNGHFASVGTQGFVVPSFQDFSSWIASDAPTPTFPLYSSDTNFFPPDPGNPSAFGVDASSQAQIGNGISSRRMEFASYPSAHNNGYKKPSMPNHSTVEQQTSYSSQYSIRFDNGESPAFASSSASPFTDLSPAPMLSSTVDVSVSVVNGQPLVQPASIHSDIARHTAHIDPIDGLTERLGEFLFSPMESAIKAEDGWAKKRRGMKGAVSSGREKDQESGSWLVRNTLESDGLTDTTRSLLIDCFLAHSRLFFEMSIPRFRYRLTFRDRRRPSLALLNAMYLWATRMSNSPQISSMEQTFFRSACNQLDISSANGDRLMDCLRAAMLLSAYSYTSGRFHEGWILAGMAVRLVMSTGLHQIKSCIFRPEQPRNIFLRNKVYLLPPPEDALELAERIHTFWCVFSIDRCGALATGFPAGLREQDITTPFPRPLADIASGSVTSRDDITVNDLYRIGYSHPTADTHNGLWIKAVTILERAIKLAFVDPEDSSEYARAWNHYYVNSPSNPGTQIPPAWLEQPKYRCPKDYSETQLGLNQLMSGMGVDGIFPVDRKRNAELDGAPSPSITPHTIMLHHQFAAIVMLLHDVNSLDTENEEALNGARKSVTLIRLLAPLPIYDVDSFMVVLWSMIAKVFIKEMHRLRLAGNLTGSMCVEEEADTIIIEMHRIGVIMHLARTQAKAMEELKKHSIMPKYTPDPTEPYRKSSIY